MPPLPAHLPPRTVRRVRAAATRWRRRALFVLGGIVVGACAVLLAVTADQAGHAFRFLRAGYPVLPFALTPAGFALTSYAARRWFPFSGGSGIPQVIAARHLHTGRAHLVSLHLALGKMLLLLVGLLCGASIGREGPTVQVGAAVMYAAGRLSPRRQPGLILAGAAAGVSAAFNTPLAGIVFGIEELSRSFEVRTSGIVLGTVIAAGLTSLALQGDYTYFGTTHVTLNAPGWVGLLLVGVGGGLLGGLFSRLLIVTAAGLPGVVGRVIAAHPTIFATLCGLAVAACGYLSHGSAFGTGYAEARGLVQGGAAPTLWFGTLKLLATAASSISGIPGGIFAPSLAVGAGLGADVAALLPAAPAQALVVLGMVAYFAGVVQAPITAFVIVTEMTNDHAMVVPIMLTALIGFGTSKLVCPEGVYHALARNYETPLPASRTATAEPSDIPVTA